MDNTLKATETMTGGTLQNPRTEWATTMHCDLKPYAFPNGVDVPRLMPFQEFPFNGDGYLAAEFLRLKAKHNIKTAIETGTCLGSTAIWLAENFDRAITFENNDVNYDIAKRRAKLCAPKLEVYNRDSVYGLSEFSAILDPSETPIFFLDAHWGAHCPLIDELFAIWRMGITPCIVIHDFLVPGTDFGYDRTPDHKPFDVALIDRQIGAIYENCKAIIRNYPTKVEGARRGWISIEPVQP